MTRYDIVFTLFTIIYGLMLTELFFSIHRLIRKRKQVKWHWLPLVTAWYLFVIVLKNWWDLTFIQQSSEWMNILFFIAYGHLLFLIYLLVSNALPDYVDKEGVDLKQYYFQNHRTFWGLMGSVILVSISIGIVRRLHVSQSFNIADMFGNMILIGLTVGLAIIKRNWFHYFIVILLVVQVIFEILSK